jgi:cell division protein FtsI (penicillin-binding protein 3)
LRQPANAAAMAENVSADRAMEVAAAAAAQKKPQPNALETLPDKVIAAFRRNGNTTSVIADAAETASVPVRAPVIRPEVETRSNGAVVVDAGKRVAVPQFQGQALRNVVEGADSVGLRVETLGSGLARDQAPAAGTMVPPGTEVVVRFAR